MSYEYINLCTKGFIRIPITRKQHNKLLPNRKQRFGAKIEYYWHPENNIFEAQYFCSTWFKVVLILTMFIPAVIMVGVPDAIRDTRNLICERKLGKFSRDRWWLNSQKTTDGKLESFIKDHINKKAP